MEINYMWFAVAVVVQFVLGALWYSPLIFGKKWMNIMECDTLSKDELQKMQREMAPFYLLQLALTVLTTYVLVMFMYYLKKSGVGFHEYGVAGWAWLGFVAPTQIAGVVWANTKKKFWSLQIFIMLSYSLISFMLAAAILSRMW